MHVEASETIERPRAEVFRAFCDLERGAQRMSAISKLELLTDGSFGVGTRWRETRTMFGKEATEEMEVTAVDEPASYDVLAESHGARYESRISFDELGPSSTRVTMTFGATPISRAAKVLTPLTGFVFRSAARKGLERDLADMKASLEREA
jgi:hypothetical protein